MRARLASSLSTLALSPVLWLWVTSRALVIVLLVGPEHPIHDVIYYRENLDHLGERGIGHTLVEYPVPALLLLALPYWLLQSAGQLHHYVAAIGCCAVAIDALFLTLLVRARDTPVAARGPLGVPTGEWVWLLATPALGATAYARFDLVPGVLVGLALLYAARRPRTAALAGAIATSVKYWPAIVLPALAAPRGSRRRVVTMVAVAGGALAVLSLVLGGWHRLFSPFAYQKDRGLQIESIAGTPAMVEWARQPWRYTVSFAASHAYEVSGPIVRTLVHLSDIAMAAFAIVLVAFWARAWRILRSAHDAQSISTIVWLALVSVTGFIATGKVFSPQYLLWLLPAAAAGLVVVRDPESRRVLGWWSGLLVATCVTTQVIFPISYHNLVHHSSLSELIVGFLVVRNLAVLALFLGALTTTATLLWRQATPVATPPRAFPTAQT